MPEYLVELYSITADPHSGAFEEVGLQANRIVEAFGIQGPVSADNTGRKS